jgi:predicted RNase H-like HicB family nuclease
MEKLIVRVGKTPKGYSACVDLLPGLILAVTGDFAKFKRELVESIDFHLEGMKEDGDPYPAIFDGEYEFEYEFDIESLLYCYGNIFAKSALERLTGINQKQIGHYAKGRSKPRPAQERKIKKALHELGEELAAISV